MLVVREGDPNKYRFIHHDIRKILDSYTDSVIPKSIDEFVLDLSSQPTGTVPVGMAQEIKNRIRGEVGEWITVSIGIAPSRFLAKLGSDIDKPDGLQVLDHHNLLAVYARLGLRDFCGIGFQLEKRLSASSIYTPLDFLAASPSTLHGVFRSVVARDWYMRIRGYEEDSYEPARRTFGQSHVLPHPLSPHDWLPVLTKLVDKAARRMRGAGYSACGAHLFLRFEGHAAWARGHTQKSALFDTRDLLKLVHTIYQACHIQKQVKQIAVSFFDLVPLSTIQLSLTRDIAKSLQFTLAADSINSRYGSYTLYPASMLGTESYVRDAIAFGK